MPKSRPLLLTLTIPPLLLTGATYQTIRTLEKRYPPLPATDSTTSPALRTSHNPSSQHCRGDCVDVYSARIPVRYLSRRASQVGDTTTTTSTPTTYGGEKADLQEIWARSLIGSTILRSEGSLVRFLDTWGRSFDSGDTGSSDEGFAPYKKSGKKRTLLNGVLTVEREPSPPSSSSGSTGSGSSGGSGSGSAGEYTPETSLLVSWQMAPQTCRFFEKLARWGYPWRMMSGGRHEMSVSAPFREPGNGNGRDDGEGPYVEVRFTSAHDYETIPEEGGLEEQKCIPMFMGRLHRAFARAVLDMAVRELRWEDERRGKGLLG